VCARSSDGKGSELHSNIVAAAAAAAAKQQQQFVFITVSDSLMDETR